MANVTEQIVTDVASHLKGMPLDGTITQKLREEFEDLHFTYCMDDDVHGPKPVFESDEFNLYLITSQEHCLAVTSQYTSATGIVIAEVEEDE